MFFISKKRFREEVEKELSNELDKREFRMNLNQDLSRLFDRIVKLENRVDMLCKVKGTTDLPY